MSIQNIGINKCRCKKSSNNLYENNFQGAYFRYNLCFWEKCVQMYLKYVTMFISDADSCHILHSKSTIY